MPSAREIPLLLEGLPAKHQPPPELLKRAKAMERHYMSARYPTMFPSGTPRDHYAREDGERAIADALAIIEFCQQGIPH